MVVLSMEVVLSVFLSEEVKAAGGSFIVVLSRGEVLLSSAMQGEERPPVLAREEVNKRE